MTDPGSEPVSEPGSEPGAPIRDLTEIAASRPRIEQHTICPVSTAPRPAPAFLYGPVDPDAIRHFHNDQHLPDVSVFIARDIQLLGPWFITGALLTHGPTRLGCYGIASNAGSPEATARFTEFETGMARGERQIRKIPGQAMLLATNGHQIYGHWLIDFLPKLYIAQRAGFDLDRMKILLPSNMAGFGMNFLTLLGFSADQIISHDPDREAIQAEELIVPTVPRWGGRCAPLFGEAIAYLNDRIDRFNEVPKLSGYERVFLSRARQAHSHRSLINEDEIEAVATATGLRLVWPEQMSLLEQIGMFRSSLAVAGPYGSALHGTIFSRNPTITIGLHGQAPATFDALQSGIGERLGQPTGYVFCENPQDPAHPQNVTVRADLVAQCLREHL